MDAQETRGIEAALEFGDGLIDAMAMAIDHGVCELVVSHEVSYLFEVKEGDALADARGDAARVIGLRSAERCGKLFQKGCGVALPVGLGDRAKSAEFLKRASELCRLDWLDEVINGVDLKSAECIFVVGSGKDDEGLDFQFREQIESVQHRHLNVEEEYVYRFVGFVVEVFEGLRGIGGAGDDLEVIEGCEQTSEPFDRERFVIDEIGAKRSGFHGHFHYAGALCGKSKADDGLFVFASDLQPTGWAVEKLQTGDEIAKTMFGRDGVEGKAWAIVEDFETDAA